VRVGLMYSSGRGVRHRLSCGAAHLAQAAALGSEYACFCLGSFHEEGLFGFDKNAAEASSYYAKISNCTFKCHLSDERRAQAAEWLQAHPLQPTTRPSDY
jgi:hypothetical protein